MCGIAGYVGQGERSILEKMTNIMAHRGPDDSGFFIDGNVGLGHRRLAIIDLSPLGHQPMLSADGSLAIAFNGEIYNFQTLRNELKKRGRSFKSESDTEVILALYQEYGAGCFSKMNGMFALALFDKRNKRLTLARDRMGKKPLYYAVTDDALVFGSELKALLQHPAVKKEIDPMSLQKYLAFDYIPTPHTIFKDAHKLEPGHYAVYENGVLSAEQFWNITFDANKDTCVMSAKDLLSEMDRRLGEAVKSRLVADVPVGIFLSGGLDSSAIAYYAQLASREKIKTFSIGFADKSYDESECARLAARHIGSEHFEHVLEPRESLDLIPQVANFLDEPMADYSIIPTYLLSLFTKKHVTVALGGDGGDELFLGYPTFQAERVLRMFGSHAALLKHILEFAQKYLPMSHARFSRSFQIERLLAGIESPPERRHHDWMGTFEQEARKLLLVRVQSTVHDGNVYEDIDKYLSTQYSILSTQNRWNQLAYLYLRTYLMDQVLVKVDRASMAASLEVRAPFLDYEFVDFVNSIPYNRKLHGFQTKYLLKELMKDRLPREIVYRKKQGFGIPLSRWFVRELRPFLQDTLSPARLAKHGLFDSIYAQRLVQEHLDMKADHRKKLWSLIVFQLWYERWMI